MAVTIKEIAAAAGVSRGTVDRVLHNRGGVRQEVADHIREIAARMGYFPNRAGKMLAARKQPLTIGYVLPSVGNLFFEDVKKGIHMAEREMRDFGLKVELAEVRGFYPENHVRAIEGMAQNGCNAMCVATADTPEIRRCVDRVVDGGVPVVTVNTDLSGTRRLCYVGCDYILAGNAAAGLLSICGYRDHTRLLVATGSLEVKGHNDRMYGFHETLNKKKFPFTLLEVYETQDDEGIAYARTKELLAKYPEANCIYIVAAGQAGVCRAVDELPGRRGKGMRRMRVLCYDDIGPVRRYVRKGTVDFVVCQEPVQQGYQSVVKLFNYFLDGGKGRMDDYITKAVIKIRENIGQN
jgi:LacI family transcriptional regulator